VPDRTPAPRTSAGGDPLPLRRGDVGAAVDDLHQRLRRVGTTPGDGTFDEATEAAVRAFQAERGIRVDGICGHQTWTALVEAGWRLGDRLLFERQPMQRGDEVAELQTRLGGLGFLEDRVDGFLGPRTRRALQDFQRNCGLTVDGICGPETIAELVRLGARTPTPVKAGVVERARLRDTPRHLVGRRIVIGDLGGVGALATTVDRVLHGLGAETTVLVHPDGSVQAQEANALAADLYIGLGIGTEARCAFYATSGFRSEGGMRLATLLADELGRPELALDQIAVMGMRLPVLRETRMPAVVCELAPPRAVVERGTILAERVRVAVDAWVADPLPAAL
jgi:N-acetylmuramoyl-L-alanine amidase